MILLVDIIDDKATGWGVLIVLNILWLLSWAYSALRYLQSAKEIKRRGYTYYTDYKRYNSNYVNPSELFDIIMCVCWFLFIVAFLGSLIGNILI